MTIRPKVIIEETMAALVVLAFAMVAVLFVSDGQDFIGGLGLGAVIMFSLMRVHRKWRAA